MACATCASWQLKESPMARAGFAACAHGKRWEFLPDLATCVKHAPLAPDLAKAQTEWLGRGTKQKGQ